MLGFSYIAKHGFKVAIVMDGDKRLYHAWRSSYKNSLGLARAATLVCKRMLTLI